MYYLLLLSRKYRFVTCKNCHTEFEGNFCNNCGQKAEVSRINLQYLLNEVNQNFLQLDRGFFYTVWKLLSQPGEQIKGYLDGQRKSITKPLTFVLITSTIYVIFTQISGSQTLLGDILGGVSTSINESEDGKGSITNEIVIWLSYNYLYATLALLPMYSLASFYAFRYAKKNYFEHIIINLYITGLQTLIFSFYSLALSHFEKEVYALTMIPISLSFFYNGWVFYLIFNDIGIVSRLLRILWMYVLYCLLLMLLMLISGLLEALLS